MAATIRIKVGASADRSIEAVFGSMEQRSKRAARVIAQNLNAGTGRGGPYRSRAVESGYESQARAAESSARRQTKALDESTKQQIRFFKQLGRVAETEMNKQARAVQRAAEQQSRAAQRAQDRFATRTSYRATRFLFPPPSGILGSARRMGSDMLRGAGVDFNFGSAVGRGVDLQRRAIALSNQAFAGAEGKGALVDPNALIGEARTTATKYGMDPAEIVKAHEAYVALTGDMETSRKSMDEMAKLSAATGSNIVEMAEAQANVANALGPVENKSAKVAALMRLAAGQGARGAIEIKNLATGMAGLAAKAPMFAGDTGENIGKLAALAQIARAGGGAKSAREAITGVERFADTFATPARVKEFKKAGINVYDKSGKVRDPFELIKESLVATGGDPLKMSKLFQSVMGKRGVTGLTSKYTGAGGGKAGLEAVQAELDRFAKTATMSQKLVDENAQRAAASDAAKAQRFQNNLDTIASKMASDLMPALEKMAPAALKVTEAFAKIVELATKNPVEAIVLAIATAIGRAALEAKFRAAIERGITGGGASVPGAPGGAVVPTRAGTALAAVGGIGLAYMGSQGVAYGANKLRDATGMKKSAAGFMHGYTGEGEFDMGQFITDSLNPLSMFKKSAAFGREAGARIMGKRPEDITMQSGLAKGIADTSAGARAVDFSQMGRGVADAIAGRELRVRITNPDDMKQAAGPKVDPSGRTKPPGQK